MVSRMVGYERRFTVQVGSNVRTCAMLPERFQWDDSLLTGIVMIDAQHKEYFRRVNLAIASVGPEGEQGCLKALQFVQEYALDHFDAEQNVMTFHEYPVYDGHLAQHQIFASRLDALSEALAMEGFRPDVGHRLNALLVEWFVRHIRTEDQRLGKYLHGAGHTPA